MPIKIPDNLPAREVLKQENIFVMDESRAFHQDIRPLRIAILNLMPLKQITEVQLLRLLGNTPLQVDIRLIHMESHVSKNTSQEHLSSFYYVFPDINHEKFDGMIITGAPVEHLEFEEVSYWPELVKILDWTRTNVTSTFHICWGAQAGMYRHWNVPKHHMPAKMFGIFPHFANTHNCPLLRGFDDVFYAPHSRHTEVRRAEVAASGLEILAESPEAGVYVAASSDGRQIYVTGHSEYDPDTLKNEYLRDLAKGDAIDIPKNYFPGDDPAKDPVVNWRSHAGLLYSNWLNYYVYQETPYEFQ